MQTFLLIHVYIWNPDTVQNKSVSDVIISIILFTLAKWNYLRKLLTY